MARRIYVTPSSDKSKAGAFFRCLVGGMFGWHYFYVGRYARGLLCLFTGNLLGIGWVLDLFKIAHGKFTDNVGMYLRG